VGRGTTTDVIRRGNDKNNRDLGKNYGKDIQNFNKHNFVFSDCDRHACCAFIPAAAGKLQDFHGAIGFHGTGNPHGQPYFRETLG